MGDGIDWKARAEAAEALIATLQEAAGARIAEHMSHATQGTWQPTEDGTREATIRSGGISGPVIFTHSERAEGWNSRPLADTRVVAAGVRVLRVLANTAAAVEAYTRQVQATALEDAADATEGEEVGPGWLRARADEIRGGQ